ncbi:MAG: hypothetical protein ACJ75B_01955 [Flavisolibacter sp.]|jgi:hypothetical protein
MALTFWAELYFRSLKRIKVISILTKYLLKYRRVCIPHIGTFEIIQDSPRLNVADKKFTPPSFHVKHLHQDFVPEHQFDFCSPDPASKEKVREELFSFGRDLREKIQQDPFSWNGFGTIRYAANEVIFEPHRIQLESLQGVPAEKVIRLNAEHSMLVGDREMTRRQVTSVLHQRKTILPLAQTIGWILLVLALAAIAYILYREGFSPAATGIK